MKKILSFFIIFSILIAFYPLKTSAVSDKGYFVVTAYYSPLPDQKYYLTGNYKDEIRLNGRGIAGASGKGVFSGMLAGPKNYKFGTKIQLEGLGIGAIEDRGGAIVNAGQRGYSYDRIDLWVGYGDEGLRRALYWGKRTIKGKIVSSNTKTNIDYKNISSPLWVTKGLKSVPNIFSVGIGKNSDKELVKKLQKFLSDIDAYEGKIDGVYNDDLIDTVYYFQINNKLIKKGSVYGAGYWGSKTRSLFLKKYLNGEFDKKSKKEKVKNNSKEKSNKKEESKNKITLPEILNKNISSDNDRKDLQKVFKELELYNGQIDASKKTIIDTVYDYQIQEKIISGISSPGAGYYGPKTRESLRKYYVNFKENEIKIAEEKRLEEERQEKIRLEEEERKKELEKKYKDLEELSIKKANNKIEFIGTPKYGEISHGVRELQKVLKELGYFDNKDTAIFGYVTKNSLTSYQLDKKIIGSENDKGAGTFGPQTKELLKKDLKENIFKELEKEVIAKENREDKDTNDKEFVIVVTGKI